jgi:GTP-binding protein
VPPPEVDNDGPFKFLVTLLDRDNFLGRILTGKVQSGTVKVNSPIHALDNDGKVVETGRASKLMAFRGLERVPVDERKAGDIISIAGPDRRDRGEHHRRSERHRSPLHAQPIDPPTLSMRFAVNDSPDGGPRRHQGDEPHDPRPPEREAESNVAIRVTESADKDSFEVAGRGELQLGVLIETMRREGL